ncbi:putative monodehydroascorbate reductase (NADH) [Lupinus albus]|uniref:Putative monodehydroascorbate reductase (NADH) n=1 Tax=Lupinus albus TaxID=3870 RepID=A0A6A4QBA5_LUPAL|nr:putative monodehydroascorbate reductase (NADH) [Lupinus albus]
MARNLVIRSSSIFRNAIQNRVRPFCIYPHSHSHSLSSSPHSSIPFFFTAAASTFSPPLHHRRSFSSAPPSTDIVLVNSDDEYQNILNKVQDNSLSAVFYFTAAWCGPCRFISPIVGDISKKYPHVTTYKIDIDQEAIQGTLGQLQITSVPTLHIFQNGKKADEVIGADVTRLNYITEKLFKKD